MSATPARKARIHLRTHEPLDSALFAGTVPSGTAAPADPSAGLPPSVPDSGAFASPSGAVAKG